MPIDPSFAGRTYPPTEPYEVGIEKIREFATAIGDANPAYHEREAAKALGHPDVIAPPTFPFVLTFRASRQMIDDPELGIDYSRVVHGEQRFAHARPVRAGDVLTVTVTLETVRSAGGHDMVTSRSDVATVEGEHVASAWSTLVVRGEG
ncbi:MAG TPA: MaoC family dehydratase N-terminal domain-containing protein [Actinomycetes bacterium]|jgi:acyl dehydratase|nr:MaoC family dehydratase N-terminal domain-containing protein [Actinomycetes bacterium]